MRYLEKTRLRHPGLWRIGNVLAAWAPLLGQDGVLLRDQSVKKTHATLIGSPTVEQSLKYEGLKLDGSSQYGSIPVDLCLSRTRIAFSIWLNETASHTYSAVFTGHPGNAPSFSVYTSGGTANRKVTVYGSGLTPNERSATNAFSLNALNHVAVVWDAGNVSFYLNGIHNGTQTMTGTTEATGTSSHIGYEGYPTDYFTGSIYELAVFDTLSPSQISLLARRPGIMYETTHRRSYKAAAVVTATNNQLIGSWI